VAGLEHQGARLAIQQFDREVDGIGGKFGLSLFCQIVDGHDGRDVGLFFRGKFPLARRTIAREAVENGGDFGIREVAGLPTETSASMRAEALEIPCGVKEFLEGDGFERALGIEFGGERELVSVEFLLLCFGDDKVARGEPVAGRFTGTLSPRQRADRGESARSA